MPPTPSNGYALLDALDRFRDDVREDLAALEGRMMAAIGENRRLLSEYATVHGNEHAAMMRERESGLIEVRAAHDRFDAFIETSKLAQARRDGALGATRYVVELLTANVGTLVRLALATGVAGWFASGSIHVSFGLS